MSSVGNEDSRGECAAEAGARCEVKEVKEFVCKWPMLHKHMKEWKEQKQFRGVDMGYLEADQLRPNLRSGGHGGVESHEVREARVLKTVQGRCEAVAEYLYQGLGEVYGPEDLEMIKHIRALLNLQESLKLVKDIGPAGAAQKTTNQFLESAKYIDPDVDTRCDRGEMRAQYQAFLRKLAELGKLKDAEKLKSMEIMVLLLKTEEQRYQGCEAVIDILCQAAAMKSVESVVESWISVLEGHSNKARHLKAETIETELQIAINGPKLQHCEKVVEEAMVAYWGRMRRASLQQGHFTRRSSHIKSYCISKTVDSLRNQPEKSQIMM